MGIDSEAGVRYETLVSNYTFFASFSRYTSLLEPHFVWMTWQVQESCFICPQTTSPDCKCPPPLSRTCAPAPDHCAWRDKVDVLYSPSALLTHVHFTAFQDTKSFSADFFPTQLVHSLSFPLQKVQMKVIEWFGLEETIKGLLVQPPCHQQRSSTRSDCSDCCPV